MTIKKIMQEFQEKTACRYRKDGIEPWLNAFFSEYFTYSDENVMCRTHALQYPDGSIGIFIRVGFKCTHPLAVALPPTEAVSNPRYEAKNYWAKVDSGELKYPYRDNYLLPRPLVVKVVEFAHPSHRKIANWTIFAPYTEADVGSDCYKAKNGRPLNENEDYEVSAYVEPLLDRLTQKAVAWMESVQFLNDLIERYGKDRIQNAIKVSEHTLPDDIFRHRLLAEHADLIQQQDDDDTIEWHYEEPNGANRFRGCWRCSNCGRPVSCKEKHCPDCGKAARTEKTGK